MLLKERLPAKDAVASAALTSDPAHGQALPKWTWILSLALLFHLSVIFITPNTQNYFGFRLLGVIKPYVNFLEFSAEWTFFSPDPAAPMYYRWKIYDGSGNEMKAGIFPDVTSVHIFGDEQLRRLAAARYMSMRQGSAQRTLVPYLCEANPGASSVRLTRVVILPTPLLDIIEGKKDIHDRSGTTDIDAGMEFCDSQTDQSSS